MVEETLRASRVTESATFRDRVWRYGPVVIWAGAIFVFSSGWFSGSNTSSVLRPLVLWVYPTATETALVFVHSLVRKSSHFLEYAILAFFLARAFRTSLRQFLRNHWFAMSLTLVALYSLSDEFHQSFVSSRTASIYDCLIDTAGGLMALLVLTARLRRVRTRSSSDGIIQST